jgi:hypothetical protein
VVLQLETVGKRHAIAMSGLRFACPQILSAFSRYCSEYACGCIAIGRHNILCERILVKVHDAARIGKFPKTFDPMVSSVAAEARATKADIGLRCLKRAAVKSNAAGMGI